MSNNRTTAEVVKMQAVFIRTVKDWYVTDQIRAYKVSAHFVRIDASLRDLPLNLLNFREEIARGLKRFFIRLFAESTGAQKSSNRWPLFEAPFR